MKSFVERLVKDFEDREYAHSYMEAHAVSRIAAQIFALRKDRGWSQKQLAEKAGIAQERVSKIESADFESLTMKTLQKFSAAFDVNLFIHFETFSAGIMDVANLGADALRTPARDADLREFKTRRVLEGCDGVWKAVGQTFVIQIKDRQSAVTPSPGSVAPTPDWQRFSHSVSVQPPKLLKTA